MGYDENIVLKKYNTITYNFNEKVMMLCLKFN